MGNISAINRNKSLNFAQAQTDKTLEFWQNVLFTDKSKFNIMWSDGQNTGSQGRHSNSETWWWSRHGLGLCFVRDAGVWERAIVDGIMSVDKYIELLRYNLTNIVTKLGIEAT